MDGSLNRRNKVGFQISPAYCRRALVSGTGTRHSDLGGQRSTLTYKLQTATVKLMTLILVMLVQLYELGPRWPNKIVNTCIF